MRILQVNQYDSGGGAANVAWHLHLSYRKRELSAWMAVEHQKNHSPYVKELNNDASRHPWAKAWLRIRRLLSRLDAEGKPRWPLFHSIYWFGQPKRLYAKVAGHEEYHFPATWQLLDLLPSHPDLLHLHNLHQNYFDLRALPWLSRQIPVILTLHDAWLLSGHCAHSLDCQRWQTGCGNCPDLTLYPAIRRDATAENWRRKAEIYAQSRLYLATPSRWLMQKVEQSMLAQAIVEARVIPNGLDLSIFHPYLKQAARAELDIAPSAIVLLFAAERVRENPWKDYHTLRSAVALVASSVRADRPLLFVALGEEAEAEQIGSAQIRFVPYLNRAQAVARYYQAADIYLHGAKVDTFPNTVLEALACGTPVVASKVGGIPEQIEEGVTGFMVPPGDSIMMAKRIIQLIGDDELRLCMGQRAATHAKSTYNVQDQADQYISWYQAILDTREERPTIR